MTSIISSYEEFNAKLTERDNLLTEERSQLDDQLERLSGRVARILKPHSSKVRHNSKEYFSVDRLLPKLYNHIFLNLSLLDLKNVNLVCKKWNKSIQSPITLQIIIRRENTLAFNFIEIRGLDWYKISLFLQRIQHLAEKMKNSEKRQYKCSSDLGSLKIAFGLSLALSILTFGLLFVRVRQ